MRILGLTILILVMLTAVGAQTQAQYLTAVRPLPGYVCMRLNLPREQLLSPDLDVPIFNSPSTSSPRLGKAAAALIVKSPMVVRDGLAEILFLDGRVGWVAASVLGPYATSSNPNARCTPSMMSNGRPGFG